MDFSRRSLNFCSGFFTVFVVGMWLIRNTRAHWLPLCLISMKENYANGGRGILLFHRFEGHFAHFFTFSRPRDLPHFSNFPEISKSFQLNIKLSRKLPSHLKFFPTFQKRLPTFYNFIFERIIFFYKKKTKINVTPFTSMWNFVLRLVGFRYKRLCQTVFLSFFYFSP